MKGHPFLTRLAYYHLNAPVCADFATLMDDADRPDGPFGDHLRALEAMVRQFPEEDLLATLKAVIRNEITLNDEVFYRLQSVGLVLRERGVVIPANGLYARFFGCVR